MESFLVAKQDEMGRWQRVCSAQYLTGAGVSCKVAEGTVDRAEIDGAVRFLSAERAAVDVITNSGWRVSRA